MSFEDGYKSTMQVPDPAFRVLAAGSKQGGKKEQEKRGKRARARVKEDELDNEVKHEKEQRKTHKAEGETREREEVKGKTRRAEGGARERAEARMLQEAVRASLGLPPTVLLQP